MLLRGCQVSGLIRHRLAEQSLTKFRLALGAILNIKSIQLRSTLAVFIFITMIVPLFTHQTEIMNFLFNPLPTGLGVTSDVALHLGLFAGAVVVSCAYFGGRYRHKLLAPIVNGGPDSSLFVEYRIKLLFGGCFGLLAALLSSLIFVIFEADLPPYFLQYHQLFSALNISFIVSIAALTALLYLWGIVLPVLLLVKRLYVPIQRDITVTVPLKVIISALVFSAAIGALLLQFTIAGVTLEWSENVFIFSTLVSVISLTNLALLYFLVGIEAGIIGNIMYCLLVSYFANIFLYS